MRRMIKMSLLPLVLVLSCGPGTVQEKVESPQEAKKLVVFCADAGHHPIMEAARQFKERHGVPVQVRYMKVKKAISRMKESRTGDVFIPALATGIEAAKKEGILLEGAAKTVAYLTIAIAVRKGNPKGIKSIEDLLNPDVKVGMGDAGVASVGLLSEKVLEKAGIREQAMKNVSELANCCFTTAKLVKDGKVDAVLGWEAFGAWFPEEIDIVKLPDDLKDYYPMPAAVVKYTKDRDLAEKFIDYLRSDEGKSIFKKFRYTVELPPGRSEPEI